MKVLVVGGGGREHALVWKISQSPLVDRIYCAPGNGGISEIAECVDIKATDIEHMTEFAVNQRIDLVVVAPDDPLVLGMVDALEAAGIRAFGPRANAAAIEGSKIFAKQFMMKYGIPTAEYRVFETASGARKYLGVASYPVVVKADGLALGKGAIVCNTPAEAENAVEDIMNRKIFGESGNRIIIEEYLTGTEVTVLAFTDGKVMLPMTGSQDHKKVFDGDRGPNTGGMGAFSPSEAYSAQTEEYCMRNIFIPTLEGMNKEGRTFKGVLYFQLILTSQGPKVIEYNARFGDPEAQVVLPRLKNDIIEVFNAVIDGKLNTIDLRWDSRAAVCVVAASGGYPGKYSTGFEIRGVEKAEADEDIIVFHAGTKRQDGKLVTSGGRVLGVTALAQTMENAREKAYRAISGIAFEGMHYRRDIGVRKNT